MKALDDIVVLDLGTFIAGPFCATLLAEFGAEVIKVESPNGGDSLRRFGTDTEVGDTLIWLSESRNKKCITLNFRDERSRPILRQLVEKCDVIVENFRPGVAEKLGLSHAEIQAINPRAVFVRISAYGQTGPDRMKPGFARIAHAFSGLAYLAGEPGRVPVTPGSTSLADYASGLYGALGALIALHARERTGIGQYVDLALYESIFRLLDELAPAFQQSGKVRERMGPNTVNVTPHGHFQSSDGHWIAIACSNDKIFARLAQAMGQPDLASDSRFGQKVQRLAATDEINDLVTKWVGANSGAEIRRLCDDHEVPSSQLFSIADIFENPQYAARENIKTLTSRIGDLAVPNVVPRLSDTPGGIDWLGAALGEHNTEIYQGLLGMSDQDLAAYLEIGVI